MDSWQSGVVTWDQRNSETTNLHDSVAMLEHEPLTAATIVTGTTGYFELLSALFGRPDQRNATGTDGDKTLAVGCSHGEHRQIRDSYCGYVRVWRKKPEKFQP